MAKSACTSVANMAEVTPQHINCGANDKARAAIARGMGALLADTYTLYPTTRHIPLICDGSATPICRCARGR